MLKMARITVAAALVAAVSVALGASSSEAQKYDPPKPITINMVQDGNEFAYKGPNKVAKGSKITFVNKTKVQKGGPHTASLVKPALLPKGKAEIKACGKQLSGLCGLIAFENGHQVNTETFEVARPDIDIGKKGWDKAFGKKGDTWYSETLNEEETRVVSAKAGSTLTFFCAIHPTMVKSVKVTKK